MNRKVIKIVICVVILVALVGAGIAVYFHFNQGPNVGQVKYGAHYQLTSIHPTDRFKGATINSNGYFCINHDGQTGELYLGDLEASEKTIYFVVTNYKEGPKQTTIDFEYIDNKGKDTTIQHLTAVSTQNKITIYAPESHDVIVVKQNPNDITELTYSIKILEFSLEVD